MMSKLLNFFSIVLFAVVIAGCANESTPYNEQTAQIDPAMNQPDSTPPSPSPNDGLEETSKDKVDLTDAQWREILSDQEYYVLRKSGTEYAGTGRYLDNGKEDKGAYHCVGCGNYLYDARHKFHSGCGWPSFFQEVEPSSIVEYKDESLGMVRTEMRCARCDGHLGHIFPDGFGTPTGLRHCVNGTALIFVPEGEDEKEVIRKHREQYADK